MQSYKYIVIKCSKTDNTPREAYRILYTNEGYVYYIQKDSWESFLSALKLLSIRELNLQGSYIKLVQSVIPKYGKELYVFLALAVQNLVNVHTVEDVLDAIVADNLIASNVVEHVKGLAKSTKIYGLLDEKLRGITEVNRKLLEENKILKAELEACKRENVKLRRIVKQLYPYSKEKTTGEWEYEKRLPILRDYQGMNNYISSQHYTTVPFSLDKNITINVPEKLSENNRKYLAENYHFILEFIAIKFTQLIPFVQRYVQLKEEDLK